MSQLIPNLPVENGTFPDPKHFAVTGVGRVIGTPGNDRLNGSGDDIIFDGGGGRDQINGGLPNPVAGEINAPISPEDVISFGGLGIGGLSTPLLADNTHFDHQNSFAVDLSRGVTGAVGEERNSDT